jgi:hypothetical protein
MTAKWESHYTGKWHTCSVCKGRIYWDPEAPHEPSDCIAELVDRLGQLDVRVEKLEQEQ